MERPADWIQKLLPTIYQDTLLRALVKPAGIDTASYSGQVTRGLAEILREAEGVESGWVPVNRLSRYESGVIIMAPGEAPARLLRKTMKAHPWRQEFVAVIEGQAQGRRIQITAEHGASRGRTRAALPKRQRSAPAPTGKSGGATSVEVLKAALDRQLIRCSTTVESTHALRAQLRAAGLRLLGDRRPGRYAREPRYAETCLHLSRLTLRHPDRREPLTLSSSPPRAFDALLRRREDWTRPLHAALVRRLPLLLSDTTDAFRILCGNSEDVPGINAEKLGATLHIVAQTDRSDTADSTRFIANWFRRELDIQNVLIRSSTKGSTESDGAEESLGNAPTEPPGAPAPAETTVHENGLKFLIQPQGGTSAGLFLDQRDNRQRVRELAVGRDVLNLFAYTCGFSVAAVRGGARSVVSVDLAPRYLEWGRRNFALNDLSTEAHSFHVAHAAQFLKRAARDEHRFDLIILDPPSFAHGRKSGQDFSIERDLTALILSAAALLRPAGCLLVSTNLRRMSWRAFRERVRTGLSNREVQSIEPLPLPVDFAMDPDHAKTLFVRIE